MKIKRYFIGFTTEDYNWWFSVKDNKWVYDPDLNDKEAIFCNFQDCKTLRAFRRKLKTAPKGVKFVLCNKSFRYDIITINK